MLPFRPMLIAVFGLFFIHWGAPRALGQATGTVRGTVTVAELNAPLHKATVMIVQLRLTTETDTEGSYVFEQVPTGTYDIVARAPALTDERRTVQVRGGETATVDFQMRLMVRREQVVVTAAGHEETALEAFQAVNVLESLELTQKPQGSLGAALESTPGVAKRSVGPGSDRPVVRGFDGDRVLVMKDGISTGTLSSQSGDHGESIDLLGLERLEVVKGPATLLYGSNAIGGVVNAVTARGQIHEHAHEGWSGYLSGVAGSANALGGGGGGVEYGVGKWMFWGQGAGNRTGSYDTPLGQVENSHTRLGSGAGGLGRYAQKTFFNLSYGYDGSRYGVPFREDEADEKVDIKTRRHNVRFTGGFRNLDAFLRGFRLILDYSNYHHEEIPAGKPAETLFDNEVFSYRGVFEQRRWGRLTGSLGFSGLHRDYAVTGEEALTPPVTQNNVAVFTLQELSFERVRLQFGGRVDHTSYDVEPTADPPRSNRSFTGFSAAAGVHVPLWGGGAFVTNYTHSYRAPALEELYNFGPHRGNLAFEIGDANLKGERSNGIDFSLRHNSPRLQADGNVFLYFLDDFVFLAPTGEIEDGLTEAEFLQAKARFTGAEANFEVGLHQNAWLLLGLDLVDAELRSSVASRSTGLVTPAGTPVPRIPPLRGRVGFNLLFKGLSVRPQLVLARDQKAIFPTETRTAGYAVWNLDTSYTIARQHVVHVFSVSGFNLGDRLYRNHLSFIKDIAPEIGRGVRAGYTVRFL